MKNKLFIFILLLSMQTLFAQNYIKELRTNNITEIFEKNSMVLIKFSAPWCASCKSMEPSYHRVATVMKEKVLFSEIDIDDELELAQDFEIDSIPTLILIKNGKEIKRHTGELNDDEIFIFVNPLGFVEQSKKECANKVADSCDKLAQMYDGGLGITVDKKKAVEFYLKSYALGNAKSCFSAAYIYDIGEGLKEDNVKALELYSKACEGKDQVACHNLALMHEEGEGTKVDMNVAVELYKKSCNYGYGDACFNLASIYEKGKDLKKDLTEAISLYQKACDSGDSEACTAVKKLTIL